MKGDTLLAVSASDPFGLVGQVLDGQFRVDQLVGEGGFSAVYRGHHQGLNEPIAIKCLKLPSALGTTLVDSFVQRFRDESRILYRLSQGNLHIVRSIAAGTTQAPATGALVPYMVLEWLDGRSVQTDFTIRQATGEKGRAIEEVVKLFDTAADGLAYAHAQGVVHRDLNPGNLFLAKTQHGVKMKVLDFGVAKLMHDGALNLGPRAQTVGHLKIFAPAYGAPEQFDDRIGAVGAPSDVYTFALIILEALRDKTVVEGTHLGEFAQRTCDPARRPTPRALGLDVADEVEQAFVRALALDPAQRWHNAGDFWQSLGIALKLASERKHESAARETPPLSMGGPNGPSGTLSGPGNAAAVAASAFAATASAATASAATASAATTNKMARTLPLNAKMAANLPGAGGMRQRVPTTIGIPLPSSAGAAPSGVVPPRPAGAAPATAGAPPSAGRTPAALGGPSPPSSRGGPVAPSPPRASARPPASGGPSSPRIPAVPNAPVPRPITERPPPVRPPSISRLAAATAPPTLPPSGSAEVPQLAGTYEEEDEATKVHAPAPEFLQTLAHREREAAARAASARPAAGAPPPSPDPNDEMAALERAARGAGGAMTPPRADIDSEAPAPVTPVPPSFSGGTLMMVPGQQGSAVEQALAQARAQAELAAQLPPQAGPIGLASTLAMSSSPYVPPPTGSDPMMSSQLMQGEPPPPQQAQPFQQTMGMPSPPFGHGSAIVPPIHSQPMQSQQMPLPPQSQQQQPSGGFNAPPPMQGGASYGQQPFGSPPFVQPGLEQAPKAKIPIVPIAIVLAVLALGGVVLTVVAMRGHKGPPPDELASSSASGAVSLTPVPVPVPVDTAPVPSVAAVAEIDAAPEAAPDASAEEDAGSATAAATASASATATAATTAPTAATGLAPQYTWPPATASAAPKPSADPNAFNESAARTRLSQANGVLVICRKDGTVSGTGTALVTFSSDGSVTSVVVEPPYAGTKEGDCAAAQFRRAKISAFVGDPKIIRHSFEVPK
jgi:serine/threonine-protein kinase